jgi:hypothetical protein
MIKVQHRNKDLDCCSPVDTILIIGPLVMENTTRLALLTTSFTFYCFFRRLSLLPRCPAFSTFVVDRLHDILEKVEIFVGVDCSFSRTGRKTKRMCLHDESVSKQAAQVHSQMNRRQLPCAMLLRLLQCGFQDDLHEQLE